MRLTAAQHFVFGGEEEMKIKSKRSHIIDTSGTGLFLLALGLFERRLPICFPFSIQEIARAELQPEVPVNLWLVCTVHFF